METLYYTKEEIRLRWVLMRWRLVQLQLPVAGGLYRVTGKAFEWYYPKPGWKLLDRLSMGAAYKLDGLYCEIYGDDLVELTLPLSQAQALAERSSRVHCTGVLNTKLTVISIYGQLCVPKAQLKRMLGPLW